MLKLKNAFHMRTFTIQITEMFAFVCSKQQLILKQILYRNILEVY